MFKNMACTSVLILAAATAAFAEMPCERLTSLKLPNATITSALAVPERPLFAVGTSGRCCAVSEDSDAGVLPGRGVDDAIRGFSH